MIYRLVMINLGIINPFFFIFNAVLYLNIYTAYDIILSIEWLEFSEGVMDNCKRKKLTDIVITVVIILAAAILGTVCGELLLDNLI